MQSLGHITNWCSIRIGRFSLYGLIILVGLWSCSDDDQGYTPLNINAVADQAEVFQNAVLTLDILENDTNVPLDGQILLDSPNKGTASITQHNNLGEARLTYTPNPGALGQDSFIYSVCDEMGNQCSNALITINILPVTPVTLDLSLVPYPKLSDYNFFEGPMAQQEPAYGVLPYEPISVLFTDYAHKKRFVWMPEGSSASYVSDGELLNFPTGAVLIKTFYYDNVLPDLNTKIIETRLLIKKEDGWLFADYIWDEAQQEAYLDVDGYGANVPIEWVENGQTNFVNYRVPATSQCYTCHKAYQVETPIGPKPQNLNGNYAFDDGIENQLQKWMDTGYLDNSLPGQINTVVDWADESQDLELRVRSYFDINCASCHSDSGHCDYRALRMNFSRTDDLANLGVCVDPDTPIPGYENSKIIEPGNAEGSVLYFRLHTTDEEYRMPLLGRSLRHDESLAFIQEWIQNLTTVCD